MIDRFSALELSGLVAQGGSLEVDGARYSALELGGVARQLKPGAFLKVCNADRFSALELGGIAASKPGQVVFA